MLSERLHSWSLDRLLYAHGYTSPTCPELHFDKNCVTSTELQKGRYSPKPKLSLVLLDLWSPDLSGVIFGFQSKIHWHSALFLWAVYIQLGMFWDFHQLTSDSGFKNINMWECLSAQNILSFLGHLFLLSLEVDAVSCSLSWYCGFRAHAVWFSMPCIVLCSLFVQSHEGLFLSG